MHDKAEQGTSPLSRRTFRAPQDDPRSGTTGLPSASLPSVQNGAPSSSIRLRPVVPKPPPPSSRAELVAGSSLGWDEDEKATRLYADAMSIGPEGPDEFDVSLGEVSLGEDEPTCPGFISTREPASVRATRSGATEEPFVTSIHPPSTSLSTSDPLLEDMLAARQPPGLPMLPTSPNVGLPVPLAAIAQSAVTPDVPDTAHDGWPVWGASAEPAPPVPRLEPPPTASLPTAAHEAAQTASPVAPQTTSTQVVATPKRSRITEWRVAFALFATALALGAHAAPKWMELHRAGVVRLVTVPADTTVRFDGQRLGSLSPFIKTGTSPGETHVLEVERSGYQRWAQRIELEPGQVLDVRVELVPERAATDAKP